jgi:hypothetical protein
MTPGQDAPGGLSYIEAIYAVPRGDRQGSVVDRAVRAEQGRTGLRPDRRFPTPIIAV